MDSIETAPGNHAWAIVGITIFVFLWLIPLFHVSRARRILPVIEVLLLLGASVLLPIGTTALSATVSALAGAMVFVPMVAAASLLWFAALAIALFAELGERLR